MAKKKKGTGNAKNTKLNKTLNHSIHNTGFLGRFTQFLTYKAELLGKRIIRIDESYTTQECCICGVRMKRKISERIINCDCGNPLKRDQNSVINIMERFLHNKKDYDFLSHRPSLAEESFLKWLDLLRNTALSPPYVGDRGLVVRLKNLNRIKS
jgi:transposase